ncbi:MAG: hypothetical protein ACI4ET_02455 [Bilifractor sp.]
MKQSLLEKLVEYAESPKGRALWILLYFPFFAILIICIGFESGYLNIIHSILLSVIWYSILVSVGSILFGVAISILHYVSRSEIQTFLHNTALHLEQKLEQKNISSNYAIIQGFLYTVLRRNQEFLNLPIGSDPASLTPNGQSVTFRHGCSFYQYQLILSDKIDITGSELRSILQSYITSELRNYGIIGLYNAYSVNPKLILPSIYLDQVTIDNHLITFDLLYIASMHAAQYAQMAYHRDNPQPAAPKEVYDDEL